MNDKLKTSRYLLAIVLIMGSASFASVPFYNWFCRVTGYGGTPTTISQNSEVILEKEINIRFDASVERGMSWEVKPVQREVDIKIGETTLIFYEAHNPSDSLVAGQASFNVVPFSAGSYFNKIECFCFEEQVIKPGETVRMPVSFYVDPDIVIDKEAKYVKSITLSYTFHEIELPELVSNSKNVADNKNAKNFN